MSEDQTHPKFASSDESSSILIVEDNLPQSFVLNRFLEKKGFRTQVAVDGKAALELIQMKAPDLVISDINMPVMNGFEMCSIIKHDDRLKHIPVILLTNLSDINDVVKGLQARADYYLTKPYDSHFLYDRISNLIGQTQDTLPKELENGIELTIDGAKHVIEADRVQMANLLLSTYENAVQQNRELIRAQKQLNQLNQDLKEQSKRLQISEHNYRSLLDNNSDAVLVLDLSGVVRYLNPKAESWFALKPGDLAGPAFESRMETGRYSEVTVGRGPEFQIIAETRTEDTVWEGREAFLVTLRDITQRKRDEAKIREQQKKLKEANEKLEALATLDGLTGLKNRRVFQERLFEEVHRSKRYRSALSLILIDVDHFKGFNDSFGHPAGDQVLKSVATLLQQSARETDLIARYGGEEFVGLFPFVNQSEAMEIAERMRRRIESADWKRRGITASFGIATFGLHINDGEQLLQLADQALYLAKQRGRNRCVHNEAIEADEQRLPQ